MRTGAPNDVIDIGGVYAGVIGKHPQHRSAKLRQAQQLFLLNRRLTAQEALASGLVSRLVPSDAVNTEAATLAAGPTRAYGAMRRMLRQSFEAGLSDQLETEKESIVAASRSDDAQEGMAFAAKRRSQFRGG